MNHDETSNCAPLELDRFLDGQMSPAERAAFEARLRDDADLRQQLALQQRVDSAIRSLRGPIPSGIDIERVLARAGGPRFRWRRWVAAAIVVLVGSMAAYALWPQAMPVRVYTREVAGGMTPAKVCVNDAEFRHYTEERFGKALTLVDVPPGLEIIGWKYDYAISPTMSLLLAKDHGEPIVLLIDLKRRMVPIEPGVYGKLHVMRHDLRGVSFIEISPKRCLKVAKRFRLAAEYDSERRTLLDSPPRPAITNSN
jgi:hypothetical protein